MKKVLAIALLAASLIGLNSCADAQKASEKKSTTPQTKTESVSNNEDLNASQFKDAIQSSGITLLDVRTPQEFAQGHLENAVMIDWYDPNFKTQADKLDKDVPVYLYCRSGSRSTSAKAALIALGFKEVHQMSGGINSWMGSGYPTVK